MSKILLVLLIVFFVSVDAYSRFGSNNLNKASEESPKSINDQMMQGSQIRYYGRFRTGNDDVLNRYLSRL